MGFTCGFFDSKGHDRKYNAEQLSSIFDGLINDGVFDGIGKIFSVVPNTSMSGRLAVTVNEGKAWFDHTWNLNDSQIPLVLDPPDVTLTRYDAVILETNHTDPVRNNSIKIKKGTPASNPSKPTMLTSKDINQHPFAYVKVRPNADAIIFSDIEIVVGRTECPFVNSIVDSVDITDLFNQWQGDFDAWFDNVKNQLEGNVVANLQRQIDERLKIDSKATANDVKAGTDDAKYVTSAALKPTIDRFGKNKKLVATITSSTTFNPASYGLVGKRADVLLVGAGEGGQRGGSCRGNYVVSAGRGGNGGECVFVTNVPMLSKTYPIVIGVGGAGSTTGGGSLGGDVGGKGGTTSAFGYSARGGGYDSTNQSYTPGTAPGYSHGDQANAKVNDGPSNNGALFIRGDPYDPSLNIGGAGGAGGWGDNNSNVTKVGVPGNGISGGGKGGTPAEPRGGWGGAGSSASGYGAGGGGGGAGGWGDAIGGYGGNGSSGLIRIYADV